MEKCVTIEFKGVELEISGDYTPYTPAKITADPYDSAPADGGTFENIAVFVGEVDITDLLGQDVVEEIENEAAVNAAENDEPDYPEDYNDE